MANALQKLPNFIKWPNVFSHGQRTSKTAKFFEIGHEIANLATLCSMFFWRAVRSN